MINSRKKKPQELWVKRLFSLPIATSDRQVGKIYFAHLYPNSQTLSGQSPFKALFAEASQQLPSNLSDATIHQPKLSNMDDAYAVIFDRCNPHKMAEANLAENTITTRLALTVLNCFNETHNTKTFRLGNSNGQAFSYLPGQYITLTVAIDGKVYKRSYSLASSPTRPGMYEITVKRAANGGVVSNWLNDNLTGGDKLQAKGPFGNFSCAKTVPAKILFVAAGSGIVPIMAMLRWLSDTEASVDVVLLLSFRSEDDIIYGDELKLIASRHNNIHLLITLTKPSKYKPYGFGLIGRIDESLIAACVPDIPERTVYLCGPDAFMTACKGYLSNLKLPPDKVFCESFNVISQIEAGESPAVIREKTGNYQVKFAKSGKTVNADGSMTLLELAEPAGILIGHECRSGQCGECMVKCLQGSVEMTPEAEIDDFNRKKGWVYSCCAYPASNVVLDT